MPEYIEREKIIKRFADLENWCRDLRKPGLEQAICMLHEEPAADVELVRYGKWSYVAYGIGACEARYQCSCCGKYENVDKPYKRCPNCGAKMDLMEDNKKAPD